VTDVDISAHALESSKRNFSLNGHSAGCCEHKLIQADVFEWLQRAPAAQYDLLVLDPPSLAKREAERPGALSAYAALAQSGVRLAKHGAVLVCCSCSAHVAADEFFTTVENALRKSGRPFRVIETALEPPDHHAAFAEAAYLKAIFLQLD
jgi:23S rRNA (cytosine1962-C5)-methyltransferase